MTITKKFDPDKEIKKFPRKYIVFIALILVMLVLVEIWVSNTTVAFGERFASISNLKKTLETENQILQNEIAKFSSLYNVATQSSQLGFSHPESIQYIR